MNTLKKETLGSCNLKLYGIASFFFFAYIFFISLKAFILRLIFLKTMLFLNSNNNNNSSSNKYILTSFKIKCNQE